MLILWYDNGRLKRSSIMPIDRAFVNGVDCWKQVNLEVEVLVIRPFAWL